MKTTRNHIREFINDNCIFRCPPGYYLKAATPGHAYSWQFYLRKAIFHKAIGPLIGEWFVHQHQIGVQYAAMESAGPAILSSMMSYAYFDLENETNDKLISGFSIRKEPKKYGLFNQFEGSIEELPVVVLDDIANSKNTITRAKELCESFGLSVVGALAIVNKKDTNDVDGLPVRSMFSLKDFDLTWDSYYSKDGRVAPDVTEWVDAYKDLLLKEVVKTNEYTVLEPLTNMALCDGFKQIDFIEGE